MMNAWRKIQRKSCDDYEEGKEDYEQTENRFTDLFCDVCGATSNKLTDTEAESWLVDHKKYTCFRDGFIVEEGKNAVDEESEEEEEQQQEYEGSCIIDYDQLRLRNIKRNDAKLASLGFCLLVQRQDKFPQKKANNKKRAASEEEEYVALRRSGRATLSATTTGMSTNDTKITQVKCPYCTLESFKEARFRVVAWLKQHFEDNVACRLIRDNADTTIESGRRAECVIYTISLINLH